MIGDMRQGHRGILGPILLSEPLKTCKLQILPYTNKTSPKIVLKIRQKR